MTQKTPVKTKGIQKATTKPVRRPRLRKLTTRTMMMASRRVSVKSLIDSLTTCGWSDTWWISMPAGKSDLTLSCNFFRFSPSCRLLPPLFMDKAMPTAGLPL